MIKKTIIKIFLSSILFTCSCSNILPYKTVRIGIDPEFISCMIGNRQDLVHGYTVELFENIFSRSRYFIEYQNVSIINMSTRLSNDRVDLIVSCMPIDFLSLNNFEFSSPFLKLSDVFVTRKNSPKNIKGFKGKIIAINQNGNLLKLFSLYPDVMTTFYTSIGSVLQDIATFKVDGAIVPYLETLSYLSPSYKKELSIHDLDVTTNGLRAIAIKKKNIPIIRHINKRLLKMKKNGEIEKLQKKWSLQ